MRYEFGGHTLDLGAVELRRDGDPVPLEPRTFDVLVHLIQHRGRVVPKEELLDEVWGDRFVGESALTSQIKHARTAVGDDGRAQRVIQTHHRVGYRFVADVVEEDGASPAASRSVVAPTWVSSPRRMLFGRDPDVASVVEGLGGHRVVTITGVGGVGKTALARQVASGHLVGAMDAVWVCELANTRDPDMVGHVVLSAIGEGQQSDADPLESIARVLESREVLLVLDNCEHVHDAARHVVGAVIDRCPGVKVVATSRVPLGVDGESVHPLAPLAVVDAVSCFAARAEEVGAPDLTGDSALGELCRRLDCVPLALELAASRARLLSPSEMLELLSDRFRLLRDGTDADDRHGSLRRTIAWSWDGLDHDDQALLMTLSVFVGPFTLEDVRAVALPGADPLDAVDALGRLVGRSLVVSVPSPGGHTRFRLLESIRDFAAEQLDDHSAIRARHASHFADLAEALDEAFQSDAIDEALAAMAAAWDNLRAAVGYAAAADDSGLVQRIVRAVGAYADVFQIYEVLDWCEHADLDEPTDIREEHLPTVADAMAVKARMLAHRGQQDEARALAARAHELCETHATVLSVVWCAYYGGDLDVVLDFADRLRALSRSDRGFDRGFADGFAAIVVAVRQEGDLATTTMVSPADAENGVLGVQDCLTEGLRLCTADPERAAELLQAVVEHAISNDYRLHLGAAASTLTQITLPARPPREAMRFLRRTLQRYLDRSMWVLISADTVMAAKLLADHGDVDTACRLLGARVASGYAVGLSEVLRAMLQDELEARLGRDRFATLADEGARWRPPEAARAAITALDRALGQ